MRQNMSPKNRAGIVLKHAVAMRVGESENLTILAHTLCYLESENNIPGRSGTLFVTTVAVCYRGFCRSAMISADEKLKAGDY